MSIELYDVFFSGAIMEGQDAARVKERVGQIFKAKGEQLERLFSGKPIRIKAGVDLDTAVKYRVTFRDAGALVDIQPSDSSAEPPKKAPTQATPTEEMQPPATQAAAPPHEEEPDLLPARTGSLIDCAKEVTPAPIPDISGMDMDQPGTILDEHEPPPPAEFNTEGLSASTASLEDCRQEVEPAEIPDISGLTATEPNTGSLEDCRQEVEPAKIPDISGLDFATSDDEERPEGG
jgi:hypothetical protein